MAIVRPAVDPRIWALAPSYRALSISLQRATPDRNDPRVIDDHVAAAEHAVQANEPVWASAHFDAWRQAFRAFGAKPQRTPCSAEALRRRVERDGSLPTINPVVDLYNAVSVTYAVPIGGEDWDAYAGHPRLVRAGGDELFETFKEGEPATEAPDPGEVIWRDDLGVTCRRWNWRQSSRTRLSEQARSMWFILEALDPMPNTELLNASQHLSNGLLLLFPDARLQTSLIAE